jgi:hypothetical protein
MSVEKNCCLADMLRKYLLSPVCIYSVTSCLTAGIVEPEEKFIARQRLGKNVPAATNTLAPIELLLETMFSIRSVQRGYKRRELRRPTKKQ